jgi:hypothetical protein
LDARPKGSKCNQDYFIDNLLPALNHVRTGDARLKAATTLMGDIDNSICREGATITKKILLKGLGRARHPAYSPDINPYDFWAFGPIKRMITDRHFHGP